MAPSVKSRIAAVAVEVIRLILLGVAALYVTAPFCSSRFMGAGDATWYNLLLTDVLAQVRAGVLPVYVGQTYQNWNGFPLVLAPAYYGLGVLIDFVTGHTLTATEAQHATVVFSALAGAWSMYYFLGRLLPGRRWPPFFLAILYVCCPGVIGVIYVMDMYLSFMALPYLPVFVYGLVCYSRRPRYGAVALLAASLSLLWAAHPPIALWCSTLALAFWFGAALVRRQPLIDVGFALCLGGTFLMLSAWHFTSVLALGMHNGAYTLKSAPEEKSSVIALVSPSYVKCILEMLASPLPQVFVPLAVGEELRSLRSLQLGYSLWAIFLIAALVATRHGDRSLRLLVGVLALLLVFLFPFPFVTPWLWSHLPHLYQITSLWPMQRFYMILAAISCFAGILAVRGWLGSPQSFLRVGLISRSPRLGVAPNESRAVFGVGVKSLVCAVALVLLACWSLREARKLRDFGWTIQEPAEPSLVIREENIPLHYCNLLNPAQPHAATFRVHDPVLHNRLLVPREEDWEVATTNEEAAAAVPPDPDCGSLRQDVRFPFTGSGGPGLSPLLHFNVEPGRRYLLSVRVRTRNFRGHVHVLSDSLRQSHAMPFDKPEGEVMHLPVWTTAPCRQAVKVYMSGDRARVEKDCSVEISPVGLTCYEADALPIRVRSLMPYAATVGCDRACVLETHRQFLPGYCAIVNGNQVEVECSPEGMAMVPLSPGENEVTLVYRGTALMRWAFAVSAFGWLGLFVTAGGRWWRRSAALRTRGEDDAAIPGAPGPSGLVR
jgi:hypothetical protein